MSRDETIKKITSKKEFSDLPKKDVELIFKKFDNENFSNEEKVKKTRNILRKIFSSFTSQKLLKIKNKEEDWFLKKHLSTKERFDYYDEVYSRILKNINKDVSIIDLGAGINGFSYNHFKKLGFNVDYIAIEAMGQLTNLMNHYFKEKKVKGTSIHMSLLELEKLKKIIKKTKKPRIIFLFKTVDSLEILERDYSKKLISGMMPFADKFVISFATKSMVKKRRFNVDRSWLTTFLEKNFKILDDFEKGGERYIVFVK